MRAFRRDGELNETYCVGALPSTFWLDDIDLMQQAILKSLSCWSRSEESHEAEQSTSATRLGLFNQEKRRLWGDHVAAFYYLKGAYRKEGERLFTTECSDRTKRLGRNSSL